MLTPAVFALALGCAFVLAGAAWRVRGVLPAAASWLLYAVYEYLMYARVLCTGECNIRVDLLLIWPTLFGLGVHGLRQVLRDKHSHDQRLGGH